ncbi:MAG: hypothetical protein O7A03_12645, partial [Alphaproteobacteria bacterium]|nr:hypothetical protein [Alphaproteobacteria bacterium]
EASGDTRAIDAAEAAIANPLLDDVSRKGAKGVLINITGGADMTLFEVDEAANRIRDEVDPKASIIFGSTFDEGLEDVMRVSIVATGIDVEAVAAPRPASVSILSPAERRQPHIAASPADQPSAHPLLAAAGHDIAATAVASASTGGAGYGSRSRDNHIPPVGPSATPATMRDNASQPFIAPRPVEPALGGVAQTPAGDPFTTRIVRPSAPEPRRKKGLNIFQRVSERVAGLHEEPVSQEALIADEAPVSAAGPAADAGYPEPTLTQGEPPETKAAVAEPQLETDPTAPALEPGDELVPEPAAADAETEGNKAPDDPEQQSLKYVETGGPAGPGGSEEDLLEIPAFLRRQAN